MSVEHFGIQTKRMVNNFELITPLMEFPHSDTFYFLQILQRKKDHPGETLGGSNNNSRLIKAYYIDNLDKLKAYEQEIITLCETFKARASINLNPRNYRKAAFAVLRKIADQMSNGDFFNVRRAYDSICGEYHSEMDKRWLIDIDANDEHLANEISYEIKQMQDAIRASVKREGIEKYKDYKVLAILPSKSGFHIISNPFNLELFQKKYPGIEVHKNNPTNLYIP